MKDFAVPSNSNFMFSFLLLSPTVPVHSIVQVSQMAVVFAEERQKRQKALYIHSFSVQKQVSKTITFAKHDWNNSY